MRNGSEVYVYGNPGQGIVKQMALSTLTKPFDAPRPQRDYNALELSMTRRFAKSWFGSGSYVYSRLRGNYAGLASSDEITPSGHQPRIGALAADRRQRRTVPALRRAATMTSTTCFGMPRAIWTSTGPLATDRPHVFKLYGSYTFKFGTEIGGFFYAGSGTPMSTYVNTTENAPVFVNGRGDMGRTPFLDQDRPADRARSEVQRKQAPPLRVQRPDNLFNQKTSRLHL